MRRLLFEINERIFQYKTNEFTIENEFYKFIDLKTGEKKKFHEKLFRGEEEIKVAIK